MSIRVTSFVWQELTHLKNERLLIVLALADFADDDGVCWPSIPKIAAKARLTHRGTQKILHSLIRKGTIKLLHPGGGRGISARYQVICERVNVSNNECENTVSRNSVVSSPKRVNVGAQKGERGDIAIRKEPSLNHQEPSTPRDGAGFARGVIDQIGAGFTTMLARVVADAINFRVRETGNSEETEADYIIAQANDWRASPDGQRGRRMSWTTWFQDGHYNDNPESWKGSGNGKSGHSKGYISPEQGDQILQSGVDEAD
jgi:hypothetical protein